MLFFSSPLIICLVILERFGWLEFFTILILFSLFPSEQKGDGPQNPLTRVLIKLSDNLVVICSHSNKKYHPIPKVPN